MNGTKVGRTSVAMIGQARTTADVGSSEPARPLFVALMEAESALAELEQRWQVILQRLDGALLTPAGPQGESKKEIDQPASQVALRLREFTARVAFVADSIEHATARLEV